MDDIQQALATDKQKKMFYALCNETGQDVDASMEKVKKKFGLGSFNDVQKHQLHEIIEKLQAVLKVNMHDRITALMREFSGKNWQAGMYAEMTDRTKYIDFLADRLQEEFDIRRKK